MEVDNARLIPLIPALLNLVVIGLLRNSSYLFSFSISKSFYDSLSAVNADK